MKSVLGVLAGLGLGSVATVRFQWLLARTDSSRKLRFDEQKAAYVGLWEAMFKSELEGKDAPDFRIGNWIVLCELVAPTETRKLLDLLERSEPRSTERRQILSLLKDSMRNDLGIAP